MDLQQRLLRWDGKSTAELESIFQESAVDSRCLASLLELLREGGQLEIGASWLLKQHLQARGKLEPRHESSLFAHLEQLETWEGKLHALQCLPHLSDLPAGREAVESFVRSSLQAENKFVRAWAYGGFLLLAESCPELRDEAEALVQKAMREEPASVKARIRQVMRS